MSDPGPPAVLLVHGGFHGAWCWRKLVPSLGDQGVRAEAIELPFDTFDNDVRTLENAIDRLRQSAGAVVVVGHSLGGLHITAGSAGREGHRAADHLVYLTAAMIDPAQVSGSTSDRAWDHIVYDGDVAYVDPSQAAALFYSNCSAEDAAWAAARLRSVPISGMQRTLTAYPVAWRTIPSTYIVCTEDHMLPPDQQRAMALNATNTIEIASDHSPFLSMPDELARTLAAIVRA